MFNRHEAFGVPHTPWSIPVSLLCARVPCPLGDTSRGVRATCMEKPGVCKPWAGTRGHLCWLDQVSELSEGWVGRMMAWRHSHPPRIAPQIPAGWTASPEQAGAPPRLPAQPHCYCPHLSLGHGVRSPKTVSDCTAGAQLPAPLVLSSQRPLSPHSTGTVGSSCVGGMVLEAPCLGTAPPAAGSPPSLCTRPWWLSQAGTYQPPGDAPCQP